MVLKAVPEGHDPLVDRDAFASSLGGLRRAGPDHGDVFATLQRVIDATRAVFQVDGAGLALEHEDGSLRSAKARLPPRLPRLPRARPRLDGSSSPAAG